MTDVLAQCLPRTSRILHEGCTQRLHLGGQIHVSLAGRNVVSTGFGDRRPGEPMTADTLLLWLSSGKPLTALVLAQLLDAGRLRLDTPVAGILPSFGQAGKEQLTPRHLLTHTGGFRSADSLPEDLSWSDTLDAIAATPLDPGWDPDRHAAYQTQSSWFVLAALAQHRTGESFPELVRNRLLLPLGMKDTWIGMPPERHHAYGTRIGTTHITFPRDPTPHPTWDSPEACARCRPGGGARGPIADLGGLYEALLDGGRGVVRPGTLQDFTRRHRIGRFDQTFRHVIDMGLGFVLNSHHHGRDTVPYGYGAHASPETFGHSGSQSSCGFADPVHGLAVAWVCNGLPGEPRHQRRQRAINTAIYEDLGLA